MSAEAAMADRLGNEIPQRIRFVKGTAVPEHPEECEPHTPHPAGYVAHLDWQERMAKTHRQRQCRGCGLWAIWEPKRVTS
jgi:hypothetical protein